MTDPESAEGCREQYVDAARRRQVILPASSPLAKRPHIALRTRSYETVRTAVAAGLGFSILNMRPTGQAMPDSSSVVRRPLADRCRFATANA